MSNWKSLITKANSTFSNKQYITALTLYKKTLALSKEQFSNNFKEDKENAVASVIISALNLFNCYIKLEDYDMAGLSIENALKFVNDIPDNCEISRRIKLHTFSKIIFEWNQFIQKYESIIKPSLLIRFKNTVYKVPQSIQLTHHSGVVRYYKHTQTSHSLH